MNIKALVSPIALASALAISGTAWAQTMIGDQVVSEEDYELVREHCLELQAEEDAANGVGLDAGAGADLGADAGGVGADAEAETGVGAGVDATPGPDTGEDDAAGVDAGADAGAGADVAADAGLDGADAGLNDTTIIDFEAITLEQCQEAGFLDENGDDAFGAGTPGDDLGGDTTGDDALGAPEGDAPAAP